jgi:hypothetical protein
MTHLLHSLVFLLEQHGREGQDLGPDPGMVFADEVPGRLPPLVAVRPSVVEEVLIDRGLAQEILQVLIDLQIEELLLDQPVHRFHVCVGVRPPRRCVEVLGAHALLHGMDEAEITVPALTAAELPAPIRLHRDLRRVDPVPLQVLQAPLDEKRGVGHAHLVAEAQEDRAALRVPDRVLVLRQIQRLHLRPVLRDVPQVLHVHLQVGQRRILRLHLSQIRLLVALLPLRLGQAVVLQDPADRIRTRLQIEPLLQPNRSEVRDLPTGCKHPGLLLSRGLVRNPVRRTALLDQPLHPFRLVPSQPLPHRVPLAPERSSGASDPILLGVPHHPQPMLVTRLFVFSFHRVTVAGRVHGASAVGRGQRPHRVSARAGL